jgi:hypothetical protein
MFFYSVAGHMEGLRKEGRLRARRQTRRRLALAKRVDDLEERFDRLNLVTQALWEVAKREGGLDDKQLAEMVKQIDLSDGQLDGRTPTTVCVCAECKQIMSPDHETCVYCGADKLDSAPFEGL